MADSLLTRFCSFYRRKVFKSDRLLVSPKRPEGANTADRLASEEQAAQAYTGFQIGEPAVRKDDITASRRYPVAYPSEHMIDGGAAGDVGAGDFQPRKLVFRKHFPINPAAYPIADDNHRIAAAVVGPVAAVGLELAPEFAANYQHHIIKHVLRQLPEEVVKTFIAAEHT